MVDTGREIKVIGYCNGNKLFVMNKTRKQYTETAIIEASYHLFFL